VHISVYLSIKVESSALSVTEHLHCNRFKNNKEVKQSATIVASVENESITLTVKEAKIEDAGVYRCEAANKLGSVKTEGKLTVEGMRIYYALFFVFVPDSSAACLHLLRRSTSSRRDQKYLECDVMHIATGSIWNFLE
jgi:hypothetical protein